VGRVPVAGLSVRSVFGVAVAAVPGGAQDLAAVWVFGVGVQGRMSRILVTTSFVVDLDDDDHFHLVTAIDNSIRENISEVLLKHGVAPDALDDEFEYYGTHIHLRWNMSDFIGGMQA
jgi:hypothetical protein